MALLTTVILLLLGHSGVSSHQYLLKIAPFAAVSSNDSDTEREIVSSAWICIAQLQLLPHTLPNRFNVVLGCVGDKNCEFVSPNARKNVTLAKRVSEDVRRLDEGVVSFLMAEGIVDLFHAIEIDERNQERLARSVR